MSDGGEICLRYARATISNISHDNHQNNIKQAKTYLNKKKQTLTKMTAMMTTAINKIVMKVYKSKSSSPAHRHKWGLCFYLAFASVLISQLLFTATALALSSSQLGGPSSNQIQVSPSQNPNLNQQEAGAAGQDQWAPESLGPVKPAPLEEDPSAKPPTEVNSNNNNNNNVSIDKRQQAGAGQRPQPPSQPDDEYLVGVGITDITGPSADINLVSLLGLILTSLSANSDDSTLANYLDSLVQFQYPSWQEFQDVKLQLKINMNPLILRSTQPIVETIFRWGMPNRIRMQAEYTYANLVVQL